jgi:hypothetical protein
LAPPKPVRVLVGIFVRITYDCRHEFDTILWLRVGTVEVVLRQLPHEPVSSKKQSQRFDDCTFAEVTSTYEHRVAGEADKPLTDTAEVLDLQAGDLHGECD